MTKKEKEKPTKLIESVVLSEEEILTAPRGCKGFVADIGPDEAQSLIEHMKNFRDPLPTRVKMYTTDMKAGKWVLNEADHIVVWRYPDTGGWDVRNGNHRMHAIVKSGTRQLFMVTVTDHEPHDGKYDGGTIRTLPQYFKNETGVVDRRAASLSLELIKQQHVHRSVVSRDMALEGYRQYQDGIDFVIRSAAPRQKMGLTVPLFLAMVRGYYNTADPDRLRQFAEAVETGKYSGAKDDGARLLNVQRALGRAAGGTAAYYLKCERAVHMFLNNRAETARGGLTPAAYPGHLLPVPPYAGPGSYDAAKIKVPHPTTASGKDYKNSRPYRIRQLLMANTNVTYTSTDLIKLYKKVFHEDVGQSYMAKLIRILQSEPGYSSPQLKNAGRQLTIRYAPPSLHSSKK